MLYYNIVTKKKKKPPSFLTYRRLYVIILLIVVGVVVLMRTRIADSIRYLISGNQDTSQTEPVSDLSKDAEKGLAKNESIDESVNGQQEKPKTLKLEPIADTETQQDQDQDQDQDQETAIENTIPITIFVLYDEGTPTDATFALRTLTKDVPQTSTVLTQTIRELIAFDKQGWIDVKQNTLLDPEDAKAVSLIPNNTTLLSASVEGGIAILNFNQEFLFNTFGKFGFKLQIEQVVYTATRFSSVDAVQFLIEGKRHTLLSPDHIDISAPLNRESLE